MSDDDLFAHLVDEFTDRLHRGEAPGVEEYAARHPALAADLRAVLGMIPALRPDPADSTPRPDESRSLDTLPTAGAVAPLAATPPAGFSLHGELGRGGMGVVYKATQTMLGRTVALKMVLSGAHATPQERVRFLNEAGVLAKFQHPHIVPVFEFGTDPDGRPYFALEYLPGGSLADKLRDGPLPANAAASVVKALAEAVGYAHARGVIHRDLKPANVLLAADGTPKVTDFGLAKQTDSGDGLTATNAVLGTPSYMSPEQAAGKGKEVGPAADVYALGAILYESLTGRPPFRGASVFDTLAQVRTREPIAVRELQPSVPKDLETVCLKCLQKDPAKRYATADALADDLARFLDGRAIQARPVSAVEKGWRWCQRNRLVASLGGLAAGLLVAVAAGSAVAALWYRTTLKAVEEAKDEEQRAKEKAQHAQEQEERAKDKAEDELWQSYKAKAAAVRNNGRAGQRFDSLAALRGAIDIVRRRGADPDTLAGLRDDLIATLALPDVRYGVELAMSLPEEASSEDPLAFDPDYTLAAVGLAGEVKFVSTADGREVGKAAVRTYFTNGVVKRKFSPDGKLLAVDSGRGVYALLSVPDGKRIAAIDGVYNPANLDIDPTGRRVYVGHTNGTVRGYRTSDGKPDWQPDPTAVRSTPGVPAKPASSAVAVSPDGSRLAVCMTGEAYLKVFDTATGLLLNEIPLNNTPTGPELCWHPNGKWVGVCYGEGADVAHVYDAGSDRWVAKLEGGHTVAHLSFHPNGWVAAGVGWDNTTRFWNLHSGRVILTLPYITGHPRFSRDGRFYGSTPAAPFRVHEFHSPAEFRSLGAGRGTGRWSEHSPPRVSPDGRLLAGVTVAGTHLFDLTTGHLLATVGNAVPPGHTAVRPPPTCPPAWSADGRTLHFPVSKLQLASTPVRADGRALVVGPPRALWTGGFLLDDLTVSPDGRTAVVPTGGTLDLDTGRERMLPQRARYREQHCSAVHPDGRTVATVGWHDPLVTVWDADTGRTLAEIPFGNQTHPTFTPDGRHLLLARSDTYALFDTATWTERKRIPRRVATHPGPVTFSPDGSQVVLELDAGVLTLFTYPDLRPLARLEAPDQERAGFGGCVQFSPDGATLAFRAEPSPNGYRVWDLRAVRAGLREFDLDWDAPAYPPPAVSPYSIGRVAGNASVSSALAAKNSAREWALLALAADPFDPGAHRALSIEHNNYRRTEQALTHAALSLTAEPAQIDLRQRVCAWCIQKGDWDAAGRWADGGIAPYPDTEEATEFRYQRAVALLGQDRLTAALADLDAAWEEAAKWKSRGDLRGLIADARAAALLALGRNEEAKQAQAVAMKVKSVPVVLRERAAALLFGPPAGRHPDLALAHTRTLTEEKFVTDWDRFAADLALYRAGRGAEAIPRLTARLKATGGAARSETLMTLALCQARVKNPAAADAALKEAQLTWAVNRQNASPVNQLRTDCLLAEARDATEKAGR